MPRPEKVQAVEDIRSRIESAQATFLTEYRGLNVAQQQQLRRSLRASGTEYKIVKMTLARLAAGELGIEGAEEWLTGPTALAFAGDDPVQTAKALRDFARDHEQLVVKAGFLGGSILLPEQVSRLADVEPRPVLLAKLAGAFQAPLVQAAGLFSALTRNTASVISQLLEKKAALQTEDEAETADGGRQTAAGDVAEVVVEPEVAAEAAEAETADGGRETAAEDVAEVVAEPEVAAEAAEAEVVEQPEPEAEVVEQPEPEAEINDEAEVAAESETTAETEVAVELGAAEPEVAAAEPEVAAAEPEVVAAEAEAAAQPEVEATDEVAEEPEAVEEDTEDNDETPDEPAEEV